MHTCPHCGSAFEQATEGCCPRCGQALAVPASEKDLWYSHPQAEQLFQHTCAAVLAPRPPVTSSPGARWRWFVVSLILFALVLLAGNSAVKVGIVVAVIFLHELGHYAGMRLFGYRDLGIFFLPFFGAAAVGVKDRAPVWQQVVVLLLGPVPGLVLGCLLWVGLVKAQHPLLCELVAWLVALNLLNLAPLEPLDGGRVVNLLLFYRRPALEAAALVVSAVSLALVGHFVFSSWILFGLGGLILLQVPRRYATAAAARRLVGQWPDLPVELDKLSQAQLRDVFRQVLRAFPGSDLPAAMRSMTEVHERAVVRPLPVLLRGGFLALYAGGHRAEHRLGGDRRLARRGAAAPERERPRLGAGRGKPRHRAPLASGVAQSRQARRWGVTPPAAC
jgi:Zn-dependent protease